MSTKDDVKRVWKQAVIISTCLNKGLLKAVAYGAVDIELNISPCITFSMEMLLEQCVEKVKLDKFIMKLIRFWFDRLWSPGEHRSLHTSGSASGYWALHQDSAESKPRHSCHFRYSQIVVGITKSYQ
jgi:hypothetical protein